MSDIMLSISHLNDYANRIGRVNDRILRLDSRVRALYGRVGLLDLWNLIRVDALMSSRGQLHKCQSYLEQTSSDFQRNEEALASYDSLNFLPISTILYESVGILNAFGDALSVTNEAQSISLDPNLSGSDLLSYYIDEYKEILNGDGSEIEKKDATIKLLNKIRKRVKFGKEIYAWANGLDKLKLPIIDDGLKFIKFIDTGNKTVSGIYEFANGVINGDNVQATVGSKKLIGVIVSLIKGSNAVKSFGSSKAFGIGLDIDYLKISL